MNFLKQAQEMAAGGNVNTENQQGGGAPGAGSGGLGAFMSEAQDLMNNPQGAPPAGATGQGTGASETLPGGRQPPTNAELLESSKLLFGAAQGQKVDNKQLAGAAGDLLGGLAAHGNLDKGQYGAYINQAEQYLEKYSGENAAPTGAAGGSAPGAPAPVAARAPAAAGAAAPGADPAAAASAPPPASDNTQY